MASIGRRFTMRRSNSTRTEHMHNGSPITSQVYNPTKSSYNASTSNGAVTSMSTDSNPHYSVMSKLLKDFRDSMAKGLSFSADFGALSAVIDVVKHDGAIDDRKMLVSKALFICRKSVTHHGLISLHSWSTSSSSCPNKVLIHGSALNSPTPSSNSVCLIYPAVYPEFC
jgi:hypothetical protein